MNSNGNGHKSGTERNYDCLKKINLPLPGELSIQESTYMLDMVLEVIDELNTPNFDEIFYTRKAITQCGLSKDVDEVWRKGQLHSELRAMFDSNIEYFNGVDPSLQHQ